jgi:ubiquinone/menaquinone biosynthesis C-methylase UbiE
MAGNLLTRITDEIFWLLSLTVNKDPYESEEIVRKYELECHLYKPEETVLDELRAKLPNMSMLDVGVGAGRTTHCFASLAKEYVGVDISKNIIRVCRRKFRDYPKNSFEVADARDMNIFGNGYFDFVLFSFNGIDHMNHQDRLKTLREIRRVTKNGGYFYFSSHNLNSALKFCTPKLSRTPVKLLKEIRRLFLTRLYNRKIWKILRAKNQRKQQYIIFHDGSHNFTLKMYYITPKAQIDQLTNLNFRNIRSYDMLGKEIKNPLELQNTMDNWIHYLCNV